MAQEEKDLLRKDLITRLSYGVTCHCDSGISEADLELVGIDGDNYKFLRKDGETFCYLPIEWIKPYLRPMSSMTEEEKEELLNRLPKCWSIEIDKLGDLYFDICDTSYPDIELLIDIIDFLNAHHFDYRGLIEKGPAIEAPKGMYQ